MSASPTRTTTPVVDTPLLFGAVSHEAGALGMTSVPSVLTKVRAI